MFNKTSLEDYLKGSYLSYAVMSLSERALPYVQDGLKPVHRRILYAMNKQGITSGGSYRKSARIVGDVIGKYHPHGDTGVYDAMVKMANPWYLRYPLIDGQGNFGSRDGDSAAAMRYTEARTTPLADAMLSELNSGAVDYSPNYDGSTTIPDFLPAPLPIDLLNGSIGIAVAMTCDIPSHHMGEVVDATIAAIKNPDITIPEIMEYIKGPDLPTGGHLISSREDIINSYTNGKGPLKIRCRWKTIPLARNQWKIEIYELPPELDPLKLTKMVDKAATFEPDKKNKEKGATKLLQIKNYIKNYVNDVTDVTEAEESIEGKIRIIVEPKSCKTSPEEFMDGFIAMFKLEQTLKFNLNAVSLDKFPRTRSIKDLIVDWITFRRDTVRKRSEARLVKIRDRLELVLGRLKIMDIIDIVIDIIRTEDDPKLALMERFNLTERQADDILEIRLKELKKLEQYKLEDEQQKLEAEELILSELLESPVRMNNLLVKEIRNTADKFMDERRTLVEPAKEVDKSVANAVPSEPISVFVTKDGWLMGRKGHVEEISDGGLKPGDKFVYSFKTELDKTITMLSKTGRTYSFAASNLAFGKNGASHISTLVSTAGDEPYKLIPFEPGKKYLLAHSEGYGFVITSEKLYTKPKAGKECFKLEKFEGVKILAFEEIDERQALNIWTTENRMLQFDVSEINEYPKSNGVRLINMSGNEKVAGYALSENGSFIFKDKNKRLDDSYVKKRAAAPKKV